MKIGNWKLKIDSNNLHHGYLIVGERESMKKSLFEFLEQNMNTQTTGNPDFLYLDFNIFAIDEARELSKMQERKGFAEDDTKTKTVSKKIFVVGAHTITEEAQNALLKVFEEPTPGTHFFILASQNYFLPTFLSRLVVVKAQGTRHKAIEILEKSLPERLALVAKLVGDIIDEKKVKQDAIDLVTDIEYQLFTSGVEIYARELAECQFTRTALLSRGAMIKMILENLMLQI